MSYTARVLACDWPGCPNNMVCDIRDDPPAKPEDYGWQGRLFDQDVPKYYVCPYHAREGERALLVAHVHAKAIEGGFNDSRRR